MAGWCSSAATAAGASKVETKRAMGARANARMTTLLQGERIFGTCVAPPGASKPRRHRHTSEKIWRASYNSVKSGQTLVFRLWFSLLASVRKFRDALLADLLRCCGARVFELRREENSMIASRVTPVFTSARWHPSCQCVAGPLLVTPGKSLAAVGASRALQRGTFRDCHQTLGLAPQAFAPAD